MCTDPLMIGLAGPESSRHAMNPGNSSATRREVSRQKRPEEITASNILLRRPLVLLIVIFNENYQKRLSCPAPSCELERTAIATAQKKQARSHPLPKARCRGRRKISNMRKTIDLFCITVHALTMFITTVSMIRWRRAPQPRRRCGAGGKGGRGHKKSSNTTHKKEERKH